MNTQNRRRAQFKTKKNYNFKIVSFRNIKIDTVYGNNKVKIAHVEGRKFKHKTKTNSIQQNPIDSILSI